jgi:hypothetical protein
MVKVEQKLGLSVGGYTVELSILAGRKQCKADTTMFSGGLHNISTAQRIVQCRKAELRGLRKSSSLTNGISPGKDKTALKEYAKGGPRSFLLYKSVNAPILGTPVNGSL